MLQKSTIDSRHYVYGFVRDGGLGGLELRGRGDDLKTKASITCVVEDNE